MTTIPTSPARERALDSLRWRATATLVAGVGLGSIGHIAAVTVATIAAQSLAGTTALAGAPGATIVTGAALGSALVGWLAGRRGRRPAIAFGYAVGVAGACVATVALVLGSFALLLAGTFLIGFANSSNLAARYAAADMRPPGGRATAIGITIWAATIGAVVGPTLVPLAGAFARSVGLPELAGPYLIPVVFVGAAAVLSFAFLRPDPFALADPASRTSADDAPAAPLSTVIRRPVVATALAAIVAGQVVMTLIMTMTPLHMTEHHHGLGDVGLVISAHAFGMFALSPLSGRLTDRFGSLAVIFGGTAVVAVSAILSAVAPPEGQELLFVALFLLGFGWNLGFVAGSALLTAGVSLPERARTQGFADALIWSAAAVASAGSGIVMAVAGYATLGIVGAAIVTVPIIVLATRHRHVAVAARPPARTPVPPELDVAGEL